MPSVLRLVRPGSGLWEGGAFDNTPPQPMLGKFAEHICKRIVLQTICNPSTWHSSIRCRLSLQGDKGVHSTYSLLMRIPECRTAECFLGVGNLMPHSVTGQ